MTEQTTTQDILTCAQCKRTFGRSDVVQIAGNWVCGSCKSAFLSRVVAGDAAGSQWHYGGFWIRVAARMIDGLALCVVYVPVMIMFMLPTLRSITPGRAPDMAAILRMELGIMALFWVLWLIYEVPMHHYWGATLGKMACGVKVVRPSGRGLSWGIAFGRYFMYDIVTAGVPYLNSVLSIVSGIMCGVDDEKRALHDRVCGTRVVYKRSLAA